jgi:NitT/TauT family transport system substrate-binding protein
VNLEFRKRSVSLAVLLVAILVMLAGCGGPKKATETPAVAPESPAPENKPAEPAAPLEKIPVTVAGTDRVAIKHLPIFVNSFGKMTGLMPEFTEFQGGSQVAKALREGQVDFAFMAVEHVLKDQSGEMKLIALVTRYPGHVLLVDVEHKETIKSVADLKGRNVGVTTLGSGPHQVLNMLLTQAGIDQTQVNILPVGADAPEVFKAKKVTAMITLEPFASMAIKNGQAFALVDVRKAEGVRQVYGIDEVPWVAVVTRQAVIDQKPDVVQKMVDEIVRSQRLLARASGREILEMVPIEMKQDPQLFEVIFDANRASFSPDAMLRKEAVETIWKSLQDSGTIPKDKPLDFAAVADIKFLQNAPK